VVETNVIFGGRLGSIRYLDIHHGIAAALRAHNAKMAPPLAGVRLWGRYRSLGGNNASAMAGDDTARGICEQSRPAI
jgi:hypothetical protein